MKILVAFATSEGQTKKIAKQMVDRIREHGHEAELYDCTRRLRGKDVEEFDAYIVAGSVHQKQHQEEIVAYATAHRQQLETKPSAFVSVSLSAGFEDGHAEAREYVDLFAEVTGWQPSQVHLAGGALKLSEYDFFKEQIIRYIVMAGRDLPPGQQDYEFTDWAALDAFVDAFLEDAKSLAG